MYIVYARRRDRRLKIEDLATQLYVNSSTRDKRQYKQRINWVSQIDRQRERNVDKPDSLTDLVGNLCRSDVIDVSVVVAVSIVAYDSAAQAHKQIQIRFRFEILT